MAAASAAAVYELILLMAGWKWELCVYISTTKWDKR